MVLINLLNEISACFTNLRLILIYNKLEKSLLYLLNGFLILISFVMLRVILGGYVIYKMIIPNLIINIDYNNSPIYIAYFMMYILNLMWCIKIFKGFYKSLNKFLKKDWKQKMIKNNIKFIIFINWLIFKYENKIWNIILKSKNFIIKYL